MPSRVLAFVRGLVGTAAADAAPAPPPIIKDFPGAFVYFMDENEETVLYRQAWPYLGCPVDDRRGSGSTTWLIDGQEFNPSRRDAAGNWIFRRCGK